jgi:hypothetical protein
MLVILIDEKSVNPGGPRDRRCSGATVTVRPVPRPGAGALGSRSPLRARTANRTCKTQVTHSHCHRVKHSV